MEDTLAVNEVFDKGNNNSSPITDLGAWSGSGHSRKIIVIVIKNEGILFSNLLSKQAITF